MAIIPVAMLANPVRINGIYYNFDSSTKNAEVTNNIGGTGEGNGYYDDDVIIPSTVSYNGTVYTVTGIGDFAFFNCEDLTAITIPNSVKSIGYCSFYHCSRLSSVAIPNSVTSIGEYAFKRCLFLTTVTIGKGLKSVGNQAFSCCAYLTSITVVSDNPTLDSRDNCNAIIETASNTLIVGCRTTVIPNSVKKIGNAAFWGHQMTSMPIPNGVTSIGESAFKWCSNLTTITIPQSVASIGKQAFAFTTNNYWWDVEGGEEWDEIEMSITVDPGNPYYDSREDCNAIVETATNTLIAGTSLDIPSSVTIIGDYAFSGCSFSGPTFDIPKHVTSIGDFAFYGYGSEVSYPLGSHISPSSIPSSVTHIGHHAFGACGGLSILNVEWEEPLVVPTDIFEEYNGLYYEEEHIDYENDYMGGAACSEINWEEKCDAFLANKTKCSKKSKRNNLPNRMRGSMIYSILYIPYGTKSAYMAADVWKDFATIIDPGVDYVDIDGIHYNLDPNTKTAEVTNGGPDIEGFYSGHYWGQVVIPSTVTFDGVLYQVTSIGDNAFVGDIVYDDGELTSVILPNSVTSIGKGAFAYSYGLTSINIPKSVTSIGDFAFSNCESLISFTVEWETPLVVSTDIFADEWRDYLDPERIINQATLCVPSGTKAAYEAADVWKNFHQIVDDKLYSNLDGKPLILGQGKTAKLNLSLDNSDNLVAFEFSLQLPEGIRIATDEEGYPDVWLNSNRSNYHTVEVRGNENSLYHFLCYSSKDRAFKGNNGELLDIRLECDEDMDIGFYHAIFTDIKLINDNSTSDHIHLSDFAVDITVANFTMGDVNDDDEIDVKDIVLMVKHILGKETPNFIFVAADHDQDGVVDVMDLVEEVDIIMDNALNQDPIDYTFYVPKNGLALASDQDGTVHVCLPKATDYMAAQFFVTLSAGQQLVDVTTDKAHVACARQLSDNRYFVICYSNDNSTFSDSDHAVTLHVAEEGTVAVEDAVFVDVNERKVIFQDLCTEYTTGIVKNTADITSPADIYSTNGAILRKNATSTEEIPSGVYIINGKKLIKK